MKISALFFLFVCATSSYSQAALNPEVTEVHRNVPVVDPTGISGAPSDAILLFDGSNLDQWQKQSALHLGSMMEMEPLIREMSSNNSSTIANWDIKQNELVVNPGSGGIETKRAFGSMQLHLEWLSPKVDGKSGQGYSNSGVFLMGLYEVQILNSFQNETYANGQAGSIYKQREPLVNASNPPGEWQVYDIIFTGPTFNASGLMSTPARITVLHNGVLIQNNVTLHGPTVYKGNTYYVPHPAKLPMVLQDHGDKVRFRNIWAREL